MRIITITNHKGGCGKTTTAINLSAGITRHERKVLLIDMDPQAHSTIGFNIKPQELKKTIYNVLLDPKNVSLNETIINVTGNLDIVPSDIVLSGAELELAGVIGREKELFRAIAKLEKNYDYIIIDSPPNLGLLTFNALVASSEVVIPIESSFFALHGVNRLLEVIQIVKDKLDHSIKVHILATIFDRRTNIAREVLDELNKFFQEKMLKTVINTNVKLKETAAKGVSIFDYDPDATGAKDYDELAREIIAQEEG